MKNTNATRKSNEHLCGLLKMSLKTKNFKHIKKSNTKKES